MSDLVERLRNNAGRTDQHGITSAPLELEAADRIEELEARLDARESQLEELIDEIADVEYEIKELRGEA